MEGEENHCRMQNVRSEELAGQEKGRQLPCILCRNTPFFKNNNTLADNFDVGGVTVDSNADVLHLSRPVTAAVVAAAAAMIAAAMIAAALIITAAAAAAAAEAETEAEAEAEAEAAAVAEAAEVDLRVLCLDRHVHPHDVFLYYFLRPTRPYPSPTLILPPPVKHATRARVPPAFPSKSALSTGSTQSRSHSTQTSSSLKMNALLQEIEGIIY